MINYDALIEEINSAYRRLSAAAENLARADRELAEHVRRIRLDNVEAILPVGYHKQRRSKLRRGGRITGTLTRPS